MRRLRLLLAAMLLAGALSACGSESIELTAKFEDVGDLANGAPVMMADVPIGSVKHMRLAGNEAVVTMSVDESADVPEGVTATLRRTSVLGERFVDLVVPDGLDPDAPAIADGSHIDDTDARSDLEDLVAEGSEVLGAISASQLAVMIEEGAKGFGGQGQELRNLLNNYEDIIRTYAGRSGQIRRLIANMKSFNDTLAAHAPQHGASVQNTAKALDVLAEESLNLEDAIVSLARLAKGGRGILEAHRQEMDRFFNQTRIILGVLDQQQGNLNKFLRWAPGHNYNTQAVEYVEFNQVVQDFVICGLNDDPDNPARRCPEGE